MSFKYKVGYHYKTQAGDVVYVIGRAARYRGYETLICSDGRHRYDRSNHGLNAGRCTGTAFDYSYEHNFVRDFKEI